MQINNIGLAGLLGAGGANPGTVGTGFAQTLGLMLGTPANAAGTPLATGTAPAMGATPPQAANDMLAPATPLSMAQLLTTAAPAATATATANAPVTATPAPAADALPEVPAAPNAQAPADALPVVAEEPAATLPATPDKPVVATPPVDAKPAKPGKPVAEAKPDIATPSDPAEPAGEVKAETPTEGPKTPVKRGPRLAGDNAELPAADPAAIPADAPAADMVAVAIVQAPARPDVAAKPQPSSGRQIGEVSTGTRKADARIASANAQGTEPATGNDKIDAATSAIAGKSGQKNDNAAGDERGQAPAFTLRQDAPAGPTPTHHTSEVARTQTASAAPAAAEPVVVARPGHLGQQMGVEIARKVEAGEDTLRVRLSPENLGKVEVTLSFDDSGKMHATVRAESAHALDLLRQDAPDLNRALDQAGIRADAQSFRFESRSDGGNGQAQSQQGQNHRGDQLAGNDEPETAQPAYREIRGDGQVDLLA